ncbi:MAG: DUF5694 domain-containing protein [Wenzhouxiangellaceae bacterium]
MFMKRLSALRSSLMGLALLCVAAAPVLAQTVTIVGTQHLKGLEVSPSAAQHAHAVDALSAFAPTQVCVERMSGSRIQALAADPARNAMTLRPDAHGRPLAGTILPLGTHMQVRLAIRPADARDEAAALAARWHELSESERVGLVALQIAGYEFHSAVLNWSYLNDETRESASEQLPRSAMDALDEHLQSSHEVYSLAVPIARRAGLHVLCTADSQEDESSGMQVAMSLGGEKILDSPEVRERIEEYLDRLAAVWRPDDGPAALTRMLAFMNSDEFAELDRQMQWDTLRRHDNDQGAFTRRLMLWHARTTQISSELYRALARGPDERVMLIIGAAHRPFNEAEMRALGWVRVAPASRFLREGQGDDSDAGAPGEESPGFLTH